MPLPRSHDVCGTSLSTACERGRTIPLGPQRLPCVTFLCLIMPALKQVFNPPFIHSVDFSADGRYLAAGVGDGSVVVFDAKTRAPIGRCNGHSAPISQVCLCVDILVLTPSEPLHNHFRVLGSHVGRGWADGACPGEIVDTA